MTILNTILTLIFVLKLEGVNLKSMNFFPFALLIDRDKPSNRIMLAWIVHWLI